MASHLVLFIILIGALSVFSDADGPQDGVDLIGPSPFVTDGNRSLTLTCKANASYPQPAYQWVGRDCNGNTNTCTWTPRIEEDRTYVLCMAAVIVNGTPVLGTGRYQLQLEYPPPSHPEIASDTNANLLSSGDTLTCSVHGGKPLVASVNFHCTDPYLPDQDDVNNATSVSSTVVIDTSQATSSLTVCTCFATWSLEPDLYLKRSQKTFTLEYETPNVTITGPAPFNITGRETMTLTCQARGMNAPPDYSWTGVCTSNNNTCILQPKPEQNRKKAICTATNPDTGQSSTGNFTLNLRFPPQNCSQPNVTKEGFTLSFIANPLPTNFTYFRRQNGKETHSGAQLDDVFNRTCVHVNPTQVNCEMRHKKSSAENSGSFNLVISNNFGKCAVSFTFGQAGEAQKANVDAIVGGVFGGVIVLIVVVIGIVYLVRRQRPHTEDVEEEINMEVSPAD